MALTQAGQREARRRSMQDELPRRRPPSRARISSCRVHELPEHGIGPEVAYELISSELLLDGQARLNLATFVTTWMPSIAGTADGRDRRQEHDRQGRVPADGGDRGALRAHLGAAVELPRARARDRLLDDRLERGGDARRAGAEVALARADASRRQADRPAEPGDGRQRPGVLGEVLPLLGRRAAAGADGGRALPPRRRGGGRAVRREHDRRGRDPRLDVRRQLRAGRGDRRARSTSSRRARARRAAARRRRLGRIRRAVHPARARMGLPDSSACSRSTPPATSTGSSTPASAGRSGATRRRCRRT